LLAGCVPVVRRETAPSPEALIQLSDEKIPNFSDDLDKDSAVRAIQDTLQALQKLPKSKRFVFGRVQYTRDHMIQSLEHFKALLGKGLSEEEFAKSIREQYDVYQSVGSDSERNLIFSAYYEPILEASLTRTQEYRYPIYRRPPDLVEASLEDFNSKWKGEKIVGRVEDGKLNPYFSREEIDRKKKLEGKGLEIAWAKDPLEVLFLQVQGSGRLRLPDGQAPRVGFSATNGLPYHSVGSVLIQSGAVPKEEFDRDRLKEYLKKHPDIQGWLLSTNPRYTFFQLTDVPPDQGPTGTLGVSLTPGRSVAVDPKLFPLGALAWIEGMLPLVDEKTALLGTRPFARFVLAQDTGGAIQGPGRLDLFTGCGAKEEAVAGRLWHPGRLYFLVEKLPK